MVKFVSPYLGYRLILKPTITQIINGQKETVQKDQTVEFFQGETSVDEPTAAAMRATTVFNRDFFEANWKGAQKATPEVHSVVTGNRGVAAR